MGFWVFGGGSNIDLAKAVALMANHEGKSFKLLSE
ncbi:MAG: hypothetical protein Ct9H90mP20_6770 [Candidatus Neomarinimicrobiota bacterium]|nr:MAG: hypothetical protein Ct9H90mP20_6770 [Candidatus Neomarinimicrobiota bacterium]